MCAYNHGPVCVCVQPLSGVGVYSHGPVCVYSHRPVCVRITTNWRAGVIVPLLVHVPVHVATPAPVFVFTPELVPAPAPAPERIPETPTWPHEHMITRPHGHMLSVSVRVSAPAFTDAPTCPHDRITT